MQAAVSTTLPPLSSARRWGVIALLCIAFIIAYFDRVNLSVAVADKDFKSYFQLSDSARGKVLSYFFISYTILQIPAGWFVDKYGVKWPYAVGLGFWSVLSALTAWVSSLRQLIWIRLLLGVGEAPITPGGMRWIRLNIAENQRGLVIGLYMAAAKVGPALGTYVAALLVTALGWRDMFIVIGIGGMLWIIPWVFMVRNDDRALEREVVRQSGGKGAVSFGRVLASPIIWGTIIGTFCYQYFVYFSLTWLPSYFVEARNLDLKQSGAFTGFSFAGMAIVATLSGWAADRLIDRGFDAVKVRKSFILAGFTIAGTEIIGALSSSDSVALFFAIFSLSGLGLMTANYWALTQTLIPGAAVGRIVGVQNMAANLPGIVAPWLTGWLKEVTGSYEAPMHAIWIFLLMGIASYVFLVREKYVPKGDA